MSANPAAAAAASPPIHAPAAAADDKRAYLTRLYYDPKAGLQSANKLYQKVRHRGFTLRQVKAFLEKQETVQIHRPAKKPSFFPIWSQYDSTWQGDLIFFTDTQKINNGYTCVNLFIELTTRRIIGIPMKNKETKEILRSGRAFLQEAAKWHKVQYLTTDLGSEYISAKWKALMSQHKIEHRTANEGDHNILGTINRACRTVKALLSKYETAYGGNHGKWIDVWPDLIENYNTTVHSSIKCTPTQAEASPEIRKQIRTKAQIKTGTVLATKEQFGPGDTVRKQIKSKLFGKESQKWTKTTYKIDDRANNVSSYGLDDKGDKNLKHYEIKKVDPGVQKNPFERKVASFDVANHLGKVRHTAEGVALPKGAPKTRKELAPKATLLNIRDRKSKDYAGQAKPAVDAPKPKKARKPVKRKPKGSNVYVVDHIVKEISSKGKPLFHVRWQGFAPEHDTLEPESSLPKAIIAEFRKGKLDSKAKSALKARAKSVRKKLKGQTFEDEGATWRIADAKYEEEFGVIMVYYFDVAENPKRAPAISVMEYSPVKEIEGLMRIHRRKSKA